MTQHKYPIDVKIGKNTFSRWLQADCLEISIHKEIEQYLNTLKISASTRVPIAISIFVPVHLSWLCSTPFTSSQKVFFLLFVGLP